MKKSRGVGIAGFLGVFAAQWAFAGFSPSELPGCHVWLDAWSLSGVTNGAAVSNWADQATAYVAAQTNAVAMPLYTTNALNGVPAVRFDGGDILRTGPIQASWPTNNTTVFVVSKADSTTQQSRIFTVLPNLATNRFLAHLPWSGAAYFDFGDWAAGGRLSVPWDGGTNFSIWTLSSELGVGQRIARNGVLNGSDTTTMVFSPTGQVFSVGDAFVGSMAELIVYERSLGFRDENQVGYYLQQKYGLTTDYVSPGSLDLALAGEVSMSQANVGETLSCSLTVVNNGPADASGVVITVFPAGVTYVSHSGGVFSTNTGEWTISDLAYQASTGLTIEVTVDANPVRTVFTNSAGITAVNETDNDADNDTVEAVFAVWYDPVNPADFCHHMSFSVEGYDRAETLTDFPALVKLDTGMRQFNYAQLASAEGNDLRFTDSSGSKLLVHELDHWDTNGTSFIWVRILQLTNDATFVAHWGNAGLASAVPTWSTNGEVWAADHALVWHMEEDGAAQRRDSTANAFHSTSISNDPAAVAGLIGLACDFDGTVKRIQRSYTPELNSAPFTVSLWVNSRDGNNYVCPLGMRELAGDGTRGFNFYENPDNNWSFWFGRAPASGWSSITPVGVRFGEWEHLCVTYDGARIRFYQNGVDRGGANVASFPTNSATALNIGSLVSNWYLDGRLDELRFGAAARSADWVWASHQNAANYEEFVVLETDVRSDRASGVTMTSAIANGTLLWDEGTSTAVRVSWGLSDGRTNSGLWGQTVDLGVQPVGPVTHALSALSANTTYYYRFSCENTHGTIWSAETRSLRTPFTANTNGLAFWLTAGSLGNLGDGGAVMRWEDWSRGGNDLVTFDGAPTYHSGVLGGQPVVRFDGGAFMTHNDDAGGIVGSPAMTVFMVAKADSGAVMRALQFGQRGGAGGQQIAFGADASVRYNNGNRVFDANFNGEYAVGMWTRTRLSRHGEAQFFKNGARRSQASTTNPANTLNVSDQRVNVACGTSTTGGRSDLFAGDIAEIIAYNRLLSVDEMDAVGSYLSDRYGMDTAYAEGHLNKGDFAHSVSIAFPGYSRDETLTNFPALVVLDDSMEGVDYADFASWVGADLRFADSDEATPLNFEIEQWGAFAPPLAYYAFESNALDSSVMSNAYDGALQNSAGYTTNTVTGTGYALTLDDATQDHVVFSGFDGVTGRQPRTMSAWLRGVENNDTIMSWGLNTAGQKWIMRVNNTLTAPAQRGELRVEVNGGYVVGTTLLTDGAWHHVAAVFPVGGDNVLDVLLYVDGARETQAITLGEPVNTMSRGVWIGRGHSGNYMTGNLDDVAIWDVALTDAQVAQLYNGGVPRDLSSGGESRESAVWVRIPEFNKGKEIFAYWGNPALAGASSFVRDAGATWAEPYEIVWHLQEPNAPDATRHGRDGTASTNTFAAADGIAGDAQVFDTTGYINYTINGSITYPTFMASTWSAADNVNLATWRSTFNSGTTGRDFQFDSNGGRSYRVNGDHSGGALFGPLSTDWVYLAAVCDGSATHLYYNGEPAASYADIDNVMNRFEAGANRGRDNPWHGLIDEMRVRNDAPSADWIWAVYHNVADQASFVSVRARPEGMYLLVR